MLSYFRFRYRRFMRRARRDVRLMRKWSANYVERHLWGKWHQLRLVRRFLLVWWAVAIFAGFGLLQQIATLQSEARIAVPDPGGVYTEAAVGTVQTLNPVLPESTTASDINRLIFSSLTRYNPERRLVGDLATSWDISQDGKTYTFHLRHGVKWHDGVPFTSGDVAFTITAIQNPDSRSPLASSWQGVTVNPKDDYTVSFVLPQPLGSFLDSTTVGIVPRHLLENTDPSLLREDKFNQNPVGTGPFMIKTFAPSAKEVELTANPKYYGGRPKLDGFDFKFYDTPADTLMAYAQRQVTSPGRILPGDLGQAAHQTGLTHDVFSLPEEQTLFFATGDDTLKNKDLRSILSRSLDRDQIVRQAESSQAQVVTQPLLPGMVGYTNQYAPGRLSPDAARKALSDGGWSHLHLKLVTLKNDEQERTAREIQRQWKAIGVTLEIKEVEGTELQQTYMRPRNFQLLLYGVNVGADPDVYPFWHSSQAKDPGVNLSGYSSDDADKALETARIKTDPAIRAAKYDAFLKAWNADVPAAVLYQSSYIYATRDEVAGIKARHLVTPADRFYGIENWTVRRHFAPAY